MIGHGRPVSQRFTTAAFLQSTLAPRALLWPCGDLSPCVAGGCFAVCYAVVLVIFNVCSALSKLTSREETAGDQVGLKGF